VELFKNLQNQLAYFNHPWVKGIQNVCIHKGPGPLQRGDNHKNRVESFKNLVKNDNVKKAQIYMNAF
jgi:hypothetical protein